MKSRFKMTILAASGLAVAVAEASGVIAYNLGVAQGLTESGRMVSPPAGNPVRLRGAQTLGIWVRILVPAPVPLFLALCGGRAPLARVLEERVVPEFRRPADVRGVASPRACAR